MFLNTAGKFIVHLVKDRKVKKKKNPHEKSFEERNFYKVLRISVPPYSNCKVICFLHVIFFAFEFNYLFQRMGNEAFCISARYVWESSAAPRGVGGVSCCAVRPRAQGTLSDKQEAGSASPFLGGRGAGCPWVWDWWNKLCLKGA